jgi:DNA-binding MarR family transcriptional regulator
VSETTRPRRPGRSGAVRPSPANRGVVRVGRDFAEEFPDGDARSTEAYATLARTGTALLQELEFLEEGCIEAWFDMPQPAATVLAVVEGAESPLTPTQISERVLAPPASMTATLDLLERRGWIERRANPQDRRSLLIAITPDGQDTADRLLPGIRALEQETLAALTAKERDQLMRMLEKVLARAAEISANEPTPMSGRRNRPDRSSHTT